jgi:hypothetical protein
VFGRERNGLENHEVGLAGGHAWAGFRRRRVRPDHGLGLVVIARGGGEHETAIADRRV